MKFYLQANILPKINRASMQSSLEPRSPLPDRDLAAFCAPLSYGAKHAWGVHKKLLREVAADLLPKGVLRRPKKGFGIPMSAWLRDLPRPRQEIAIKLGPDAAILGRAWTEHAARKRDHRGLLWAWLCLDRWYATLRGLPQARRQEA